PRIGLERPNRSRSSIVIIAIHDAIRLGPLIIRILQFEGKIGCVLVDTAVLRALAPVAWRRCAGPRRIFVFGLARQPVLPLPKERHQRDEPLCIVPAYALDRMAIAAFESGWFWVVRKDHDPAPFPLRHRVLREVEGLEANIAHWLFIFIATGFVVGTAH